MPLALDNYVENEVYPCAEMHPGVSFNPEPSVILIDPDDSDSILPLQSELPVAETNKLTGDELTEAENVNDFPAGESSVSQEFNVTKKVLSDRVGADSGRKSTKGKEKKTSSLELEPDLAKDVLPGKPSKGIRTRSGREVKPTRKDDYVYFKPK